MKYLTTTDGQPLTTSDGSYVVIEVELDPQDLRLSTPRTPMFTHRGKRSSPGFTGPYRS